MTPQDHLWYVQLAQARADRKREVARLEAEDWQQRHPPGTTYTLDSPPTGPTPQDAA